ncbi:histidinol-phosphate transaminase [Puteibacter caeruleilacunae]|nr:histidinol-phosphate transaminase [Puteibacter caeruleilacunae]
MFELSKILRDNIRQLKPYSSARDEFSGEAEVLLDANENPFNQPFNRYPDPYQRKLKDKIAGLKGVDSSSIFLGNGSDEPIDLLFRACCKPGVDNVVTIAPTYGMYQVAADINAVEVRKVLLTEDFQLDVDALLSAVDENTKMIFLCSPNNPTGNVLDQQEMLKIIGQFNGIVVVDEAYIDFAPSTSLLGLLSRYPNLVVLQTFSKAWGMAGIRLGMAFASDEIIQVLSKIKYPYNLNMLTQEKAMELLDHSDEMNRWVEVLLHERRKMEMEMIDFPFVEKIYPSDANFILIKVHDLKGIYDYLVDEKIIIRDRSKVELCEGCLRISIGSSEENQQLVEALKALI